MCWTVLGVGLIFLVTAGIQHGGGHVNDQSRAGGPSPSGVSSSRASARLSGGSARISGMAVQADRTYGSAPSSCGFVLAYFTASSIGDVWSGNTWDTSGQVVPLPAGAR
jgi:hypothetical protein